MTLSPSPDLSVIIVSFNTVDLLRDCLQSVYAAQGELSLEVLVVDNDSRDESVRMVRQEFPEARLIENKVNVGFSRANNQALRIAKGNHLLLLNSDTVVNPDVFAECLRFMEADTNIGAMSCKVMMPNGQLDLACRRSFPTPLVALWRLSGLYALFPKSRIFGQYNLTYLDEDETYEVDAVVGAFMWVRRETFLQIGVLDESFFMYGEDMDWCYRIRQAGYSIYYHPAVSILHYKGASSKKRRPPRMVHEFHRAMILFYGKFFARRNVFWVNWMISIGVWFHLVGDLMQSLPYFWRRSIDRLT